MPTSCISFRETGYFSALICDYLIQEEKLRPFYHRFPTLENFKSQIREKQATFPLENRKRLSEVLEHQYATIQVSEATLHHIKMLKEKHTFTVTTGHQLNLFTGPLYFLYKIISTIQLTKQLKKTYPEYHFVPIYWMATEDHDFDEINYFNYNGKKLHWDKEVSGAVGAIETEGLDKVFNILEEELGPGKYAADLKSLFKEAYTQHQNLAMATLYLANALFGDYGLVIIDADQTALKQLFVPYIKDELCNETSFKAVSSTAEALGGLSSAYKIQVQPRTCNLFYLKPHLRERIIKENDIYYINDTDITFTQEEILKEVKTHPERFSPNVIMRPLYQEVILPNLCYIGGGGELAYWLELKAYFSEVDVPFPMLMLRNSALIMTKKQSEKLKKLNISSEALFLDYNDLIRNKIEEISEISIDLTPQKKHLQQQFDALYTLAERTDKSFLGAVKAQEVKQLKGLCHLEKRLLKAQKRKEADHVNRIEKIYHTLFPNKSLQERSLNFSEFYMKYGKQLIPMLMEELDPFQHYFLIIKL